MKNNINPVLRKKPQFWSFQFLLLCLVLLMSRTQGMITVFTLFCLLFIPKIKYIDNNSVLLLLFSFSYIFIAFVQGIISGSTLLIYGLPWFIFYNYGKYQMNNVNSEREIIDLIIILAICIEFPVIFSTLQKIITTGSLVDTTRMFYLYNKDDSMITSTAICVSLFIGYAGLPAFFLLPRWKWERWAFLILFVLSIMVAVNVVTRFPILVAAICFLLILFLKYRGGPFRFMGILLLIAGIIFVLYYQGGSIGQVFEAYSERNKDLDEVTSFGTRTYRWSYALNNLFHYPFGWYGISEKYSFMHNMWLDIARYSGIIPFLLLSSVTIKSFITNVRILKYTKTSLAYIFLALNLCFCMVVFVEPVYGGLTVGLGCMIWGMQEAYLNKLKTKRA